MISKACNRPGLRDKYNTLALHGQEITFMQRRISMAQDSIKRFSKSKGYESIPRELLQSKELTLEAIGLLCNMTSYPDTWVLRKTELRRRFVNKEKVVDRIWDELVRANYIIQFRKRVGRIYEYQYFFNVEKFTVQEIQEMCDMMYMDGFVLYHKSMGQSKNDIVAYKDFIFLSDDDKEKLNIDYWTSQNGNPTECDDINVSWTSQNGHSKLDIPKREHNRLTNNKLTKKKDDDDDNKYNNKARELEILSEIQKLSDSNSQYRNLVLILRGSNVQLKDILSILNYFESIGGLFDKRLVKQQLEWMKLKSEESGGISDFGAYFIGGYEKRLGLNNLKSYSNDEIDLLLGIEKPSADIPMHDWTNQDE